MGVEVINLVRPLTTRELAKVFGVSVGCVRNCRAANGVFMGIQPVKLPNGHLRWSAERVAEVLAGGATHGAT